MKATNGNGEAIGSREKIIEVALKLFAERGMHGVSMDDIAREVGIKKSSIYSHYESKESIFNEIVVRFKKHFDNYFDCLKAQNDRASSIPEVIDNMFAELLDVKDMLPYYGISLIFHEQFENPLARESVFNILFLQAISVVKGELDRVSNMGGNIKTDNDTLALIIIFAMLTCNSLRIHEKIGNDTPMNCKELYAKLKDFISDIIKVDK
jgi:AcrR family transcriptional regulator